MALNRRSRWPQVSLDDVVAGVRFSNSLLRVLRHPVSTTDAKTVLHDRIAHRTSNFLAMARDAIYPMADNPYHRLLQLAGCEYGDLERLIAREGLEGGSASPLSGRCLFDRG